ncbi:DUF3566 domain-containing protein [Isoptericola cucumis]|uniref:DUF3566 domain-containing protein n=1 Tax=Isoptericola cucumis TaxID=1776856 RepID=UPI00320A3DB7
MSENSASTRTSGANATPVPAPPAAEPEIDDQTHRRSPVPSSSTGAAPGEPARVLGTVSAGAAASAEAPGSAGTGASPVKDGAVKAAAAALAAAKSAAKKVQSVMPDPARPQEGEAPAAPSAQEPRPEMHYSSGDVHPAVATGIGTAGAASGVVRDAGPRRVRLSISRVDPWSVMKLAFLLSVAIGFMTVVATMVVWYVLNDMGTFHTVQDFLQETVGPQTVNIVQFIEFDRVVSLSVLIAIVNVVLLTAIATIMAILYNITAALVGGAHLTLTDE